MSECLKFVGTCLQFVGAAVLPTGTLMLRLRDVVLSFGQVEAIRRFFDNLVGGSIH